MSENLSLKEIQKEWLGTYKAYAYGFTGSILLTIASFLIVIYKAFPPEGLFYGLLALALCQAVVQLFFFLHVGQEAHPRWESLVFYFMITVLLIIGLGSLWIMFDLRERVMPAMKTEMTHD